MTAVPAAPPGQLPVATPAEVRRAALRLVRQDHRAFTGMIVLNILAAGAGLAGPWLLGIIINTVTDAVRRHVPGRDTVPIVDRLALAILVFTVAELILARYARDIGYRFGERTSARVREQFLDRALALPASVVERVSTGDLTTRGTRDVSAVASTLRDAAPDVVIAVIQALLVIGAVVVIDPLLGACGLLGLAGIWVATRWYLRRARTAYLAVGAANSVLAETLTSTATGARTVEALSLQQRRITTGRDGIDECYRVQRRTLFLRTVLFPSVDICYVIPVCAVLLIGGALYQHDLISLGAVTASALYLRQLSVPLDAILLWVEQLQNSSASFARVEGLGQILPARLAMPTDPAVPTGPARPAVPTDPAEPVDDQIEVTGVCYAYERARDVLHEVNLTVRPGERLAVVGPSGAGKSTLGRLLAGIDRPRTGTVTVGRVPIADLHPHRLRRQVVLVTQENHVFHDSVRDNLLIAQPSASEEQLRAALAAVGAGWVDDLPDGLDTGLGGDGYRPDAAQAQQLALARVVLADPHTLILDEATARLDPTSARDTERALAAVLAGRTVIAIAHRLQTAHDADRVAVMDHGRIAELGTHDELVAAGGGYAALWHSWHGDA